MTQSKAYVPDTKNIDGVRYLFANKILDALGMGGEQVTDVDLHFGVDEIALVTVKRHLSEGETERIARVLVEFKVGDGMHACALEDDIEDLLDAREANPCYRDGRPAKPSWLTRLLLGLRTHHEARSDHEPT